MVSYNRTKRSECKNFAGVHDVERVQRLLDLAHHIQPLAMLGLKEFDLAAAYPVLARAGAFHGDGAVDEPIIEALDPLDFRLIQRIAVQHHMEIAIAHMANDGAE